ncbi:MAG: hypothetical protein IJS61_09760 [Firmicutes bacterium]|nr:hypothetical protein [Bacillota bacterium]
MFEEKVKVNKVKIIDSEKDSTVKELFAKANNDGTVVLRWLWPKDKNYRSAIVFEVGDEVRADIDQIYNATLTGKYTREFLAIREDFNFSFPVKADMRKSRFAVFPFYIDDEENMCIPRQENNITEKVIRSITVNYSIKPEGKTMAQKALSFFKKSASYKKIFIELENAEDIRSKEDILYYKVKGEGKDRLYCVDIDCVRDKENMFFYVKNSEDVELVSGPDQNIIYNKK